MIMAATGRVPGGSRGGRRVSSRARRALAAGLPLLVGVVAEAQLRDEFLSRTSPQPAFQSPEPAKYNLKWGDLKGRLRASTQFEYNDNINLSHSAPNDDFIVTPQVGVGFWYPINQNNFLHFDLGLGYRWYLMHPKLSSLQVTPDTHLDYKVLIKDVQVNLHDELQVQVDPTDRPELSGGSAVTSARFRRIVNNAGVSAAWQPLTHWTLMAGYTYTMDRGLNSDFEALDHDTHTFTAGSYHVLSPHWTVGLNGSYSLNQYLLRVQNDSTWFTLGPSVTFKPTKFLLMEAGVGYSRQDYGTTGTLADTHDYSGLSAHASIRHTINSRLSHSLQFRRGSDLGFGSNYTLNQNVQYGISYSLSSALTLHGTAAYDQFETSATGGDKGSQWLGYVGTSIKLARAWSLGLGYSIALKSSDLPDHGYQQNRFTAELVRQF